MSTFFEKNIALIAGIVLPILLVVFLTIIMTLIKNATLPPTYDFMYISGSFNNVKVTDNKLILQYNKGDVSHNKVKVFIFNVNSNQSEELKLDFSKPPIVNNYNEEQEVFSFTEFTIDQNAKSPDGYTFNYNYRSTYPYSDEPNTRFMITKNGKSVIIPTTENYIRFVGWIIPRARSNQ